jgi:ABC-type transport system involved in cytochrome c biogenesis permease subunit
MIKRFLYGFFLVCVIASIIQVPSSIDRSIGRLPVLHDGRVKPFDTLARHYLLQIQGRLSFETSPVQWLFSLMCVKDAFLNAPLILVEHPKLFDSIDLKYRKQKYRVSQQFLDENLELIKPFITSAMMLDKQERTAFQNAAYVLFMRYETYTQLRQNFFPFENQSQLKFWNEMLLLTKEINPTEINNSSSFSKFIEYYDALKSIKSSTYFVFGETWHTLPEAALDKTQQNKDILSHYLLLSDAYNQWQPSNELAPQIYNYSSEIIDMFKSKYPMDGMIIELEYLFNILNPFMVALFLYFIIVCIAFLSKFFNFSFGKTAIHTTWFLALAFHSFGLIARMIILMRPPVINLYSSAIFIAFISSFIGFFMFKRTRELFYAGYISSLSTLSLIVAYHLSLSGDTLEVMQAVLNSNFWLSTHVVSMTIGYAIIFMAGFFAISYILIGTLTPYLTKAFENKLLKLVTIFLMISLFFNLLGTVLGGIWADQSWGRFWGWDPKENGAILIVLWIAIILHMKWGKLLTNRSLMAMTVFSNIVTVWSWKGTNMLGIGLHSYGFTESTFYWLMMFFVSQMAIIMIGAIPLRFWRSHDSL